MPDPIGANPRIRQCASHLARKFHDTRERYRAPDRLERYDWSELPDNDRDLLVRTFYSLVYSGSVICPVPEHRIGVSLRGGEQGPDSAAERWLACSDPPAESCSDVGCPVHGDDDVHHIRDPEGDEAAHG